jgi:hypothetical protein
MKLLLSSDGDVTHETVQQRGRPGYRAYASGPEGEGYASSIVTYLPVNAPRRSG